MRSSRPCQKEGFDDRKKLGAAGIRKREVTGECVDVDAQILRGSGRPLVFTVFDGDAIEPERALDRPVPEGGLPGRKADELALKIVKVGSGEDQAPVVRGRRARRAELEAFVTDEGLNRPCKSLLKGRGLPATERAETISVVLKGSRVANALKIAIEDRSGQSEESVRLVEFEEKPPADDRGHDFRNAIKGARQTSHVLVDSGT